MIRDSKQKVHIPENFTFHKKILERKRTSKQSEDREQEKGQLQTEIISSGMSKCMPDEREGKARG